VQLALYSPLRWVISDHLWLMVPNRMTIYISSTEVTVTRTYAAQGVTLAKNNSALQCFLQLW
jgi:hypothetical protein